MGEKTVYVQMGIYVLSDPKVNQINFLSIYSAWISIEIEINLFIMIDIYLKRFDF